MAVSSRLKSAATGFFREAAAFDWPRVRTLFGMFLFRLVPDLYLLRPLTALCLRIAGVRLDIFGIYARGPLYLDQGRNLSIGKGTFINLGSYFQNAAPVMIGRRCQIGPFCVFATTNHADGKTESYPIRIGDGVWLGAGVKVLPGAVIPDGVSIAAGTVVAGEIHGGLVWGGNPARRLA